MRSSFPASIFVVAALFALVSMARFSSGAVTCSTVFQDLKPCVSYLQTGSGSPPADCCSGAKALAGSATTTADRQVACGCLKTASKSLKFNAQLAQAIPKSCGINLPYPISPSFDCSSIQ